MARELPLQQVHSPHADANYLLVAPEQAASYGVIIDDILSKSDLESVSRSQVRKQLESRIGQDLSEHKASRYRHCIKPVNINHEADRPRSKC